MELVGSGHNEYCDELSHILSCALCLNNALVLLINTLNLTEIYSFVFWSMVVIASVVFVILLTISAPYGMYKRQGWGAILDSRAGWFLMEAPASLIMLGMFTIVLLFIPLR